MIKKVKGGYVVVHHLPGPDYGKRVDATKKPVSHEKALEIHTAIYMSEHGKSKRKKG